MIKIGRDRLVGRETYPIICSLESLDSSKQGVTHTNSLYQTGPNKEGGRPIFNTRKETSFTSSAFWLPKRAKYS